MLMHKLDVLTWCHNYMEYNCVYRLLEIKNYDLLNYIEYNCGCRQIGNGIVISSSEHELYVLT